VWAIDILELAWVIVALFVGAVSFSWVVVALFRFLGLL
jgi:hypothetical protein